jgi:hypothetical protein
MQVINRDYKEVIFPDNSSVIDDMDIISKTYKNLCISFEKYVDDYNKLLQVKELFEELKVHANEMLERVSSFYETQGSVFYPDDNPTKKPKI